MAIIYTGKNEAILVDDEDFESLSVYSWHIDNLDTQSLRLASEGTRRVSEEVKTGAPVMRIWRFQATKVGQTEIKMDCYRTWEGVEKSTDHFFIKITIIEKRR